MARRRTLSEDASRFEGLGLTARLFRNGRAMGTVRLTLTGGESEQIEDLFAAVTDKMEHSGVTEIEQK